MLCPCSNIKNFLLWLEKETFRLMDDWLKPQQTQILSFSSRAAYWEPGHSARISTLGNNEGNLPVIQLHEKKSADSPQPHPPNLKTFGKCKPVFFFFISKSECFNHNSIFRVPKTVTHQPQRAHRDVLSLRWPLWPCRPTKPLCTIPPKKEMLACPQFAHLSTANKWSCTHSTLQWWREIEQEIEK